MGRQQREQSQRSGRSSAPVSLTDALFNQALLHFKANRLSEALGLFQQVLAVDPRHTGSLTHLASIALRIGHSEDAIKLSLQTIALTPDNAGAHRTLADAFAITRRFAEAEKHYERTLALRPDATGFANLATIYMSSNDMDRALQTATSGLKHEETPKLKAMFVNCVRRGASIPNDDALAFLVRAISEPWQRPGNLARASVALLKRDTLLAAAMERAEKIWPARTSLLDLYGQGGLPVISGNRLLRVLLENTQFADVALERLLTLTRSALLEAATTGKGTIPAGDDVLAFVCALAQQCFTNDYVFACSSDEVDTARMLGEQLGQSTQDPLTLAIVAAFQPLHTLEACETLQNLSWPSPVESLFKQQVREPAAIHAVRGSIPQLTPIDDQVSTLVRQQYEENPYPRWVKTAPDTAPESLDRLMQSRAPDAPYRPLGKADTVDVLIAGCGTGQQVVEIATSILNARVTAVDLSLSSLSYAKYRTDALGLSDIEYGQADILELPALGRRFDYIVCSGVLHHMNDPLEGWRRLLSMLRPNGLMRIALYSEAARTDFVAAQNLIAARGYGASANDIRMARQEIMGLDDSSPAKGVTGSGDFFGTSSCRDLLFHVQEQRFTLPRIKAFLNQHELEFLGFLLRAERRREYLEIFPQDKGGIDLDNWHAFEGGHPAFFRGMYQFHVQKRA
jgi:2-polyprenyl-3-methyl-5-hydroxy-6-metoxy-1,4-benzoquinol methylase/tetratricopeptide (TPR) repeat protein